jgi:hypothetical protein
MAWQTDATELLRVLINDLDCTQTYSDERLLRVLIASSYQLLRKAAFSQSFVVNISKQTITPDPTDTTNGTNDENFINLMCLKAACIIDTGSAIKAANNAIAGKDLDVAFDLKGVATSTLALLDKGYCATFEAAFDEYLAGSGVISAAVMGPFRIFARNYGPFPY